MVEKPAVTIWVCVVALGLITFPLLMGAAVRTTADMMQGKTLADAVCQNIEQISGNVYKTDWCSGTIEGPQ